MDLDRQARESEERRARLKQVYRGLDDTEIEVRSKDRTIKVVAAMNGQILGIEVSDELCQRGNRRELEAALLATVQAAQDAARHGAEQAIQEAWPQFSVTQLLDAARS